MKNFYCLLLLLNLSFAASAAGNEEAKSWLNRLSQSLKQLNFSTSFVVVKNNQAEPYHWLHGVSQDKLELEIIARLNGPRRDVLRKGGVVSYIEPEKEVYSIAATSLTSPIPSIFSHNISDLEGSYRFISVGRSRVLGRVAQLIRIVAKDNHRFGYWLWLDQQSGLLLKTAVITRQGQMLEQIQFTHLDITNDISENLVQLQETQLPAVIELTVDDKVATLFWQINWLPKGFKAVKSNRRRIHQNKKPVEFMLFSDGLVDISVYVNPSADKQRPAEYASDGATLVFNRIINGLEVSVVGKIPLATAKKIADSIAPATSQEADDIELTPVISSSGN
jgi:sigma-E factor negative regulatory protein RseB